MTEDDLGKPVFVDLGDQTFAGVIKMLRGGLVLVQCDGLSDWVPASAVRLVHRDKAPGRCGWPLAIQAGERVWTWLYQSGAPSPRGLGRVIRVGGPGCVVELDEKRDGETQRRWAFLHDLTRVLYATTCVQGTGRRSIVGAMQGRHMRRTRLEAQRELDRLLEGGERPLIDIMGPQSRGTFRVDAFECWFYGDPKGIYPYEGGDL